MADPRKSRVDPSFTISSVQVQGGLQSSLQKKSRYVYYRLRKRLSPRKFWNNLRLADTRRRLIGLRDNLILTYDNTAATDGVGSQLHKIYGTYSVSRLLGICYFHTPLG